MTKILFWVISCILFPILAEGSNWIYLDTGQSETEFYIDSDSIRSSNEFKKAWTKQVSSDKSYSKIYKEFNCKENKLRILQTELFRHDGSISAVDNKSPEWDYISPDSINETIFDYLCK